MSCHDARERFSELVDGALDPGTREAVDAHVSGCPECRRDLDRLERTVALLRTVEPVRAPVGFVDRVLDAAKPVPWHRRVGERRARVRPFGVPIEAAALVLVATLAVYVFERTPELQEAARVDTLRTERPDVTRVPKDSLGTTMTVRGGDTRTPATPEQVPQRASDPRGGAANDATGGVRVAPDTASMPASSETAPPPTANPPSASPRTPDVASQAARREVGPESPPVVPGGPHGKLLSGGDVPDAVREPARRDVSGPARDPAARPDASDPARAPAARPDASGPPPPAPAPAHQTMADSRDATTSAGSSPPEFRPKRQSPDETARSAEEASRLRQPTVPYHLPLSAAARLSPRIVGRLEVADRDAADRELAALLSRVGGGEMGRRAEGSVVVVDVVVPGPRYAAFSGGLARIGTWTADATPTDLPAQVMVTLRITR